VPNTPRESKPSTLRDRDIFQDKEGRTFVALGYIQPQDRVLSFLKYLPDPNGGWSSRGVRYKRVFWGGVDSVAEGVSLLPEDYTFFDAHFNTELIEPPRSSIFQYYSPEARLGEILTDGPQDQLEERIKRVAEALHDRLGIPFGDVGVAGSILWRAHDPDFSDINLNIYGLRNSGLLLASYDQLADSVGFSLRSLPDWVRAMERVSTRMPVLTEADLRSLFSRRKAVCLDGQCIGITPVLRTEEAPIQHSAESYETILEEPLRIRATIEDDVFGLFTPALYSINSAGNDDTLGRRVNRILAYDGAFSGLFMTGDSVEVSGTLQVVRSNEGEIIAHQLMVGTKAGSGQEYIRFCDDVHHTNKQP
jgi:predicted nucleotidyltransferase